MSLNRARILSSENDASVKQDQNTNINIKISRETGPIGRPTGAHEVRSPGMSSLATGSALRENNANFTIPQDPIACAPASPTPGIEVLVSQVKSAIHLRYTNGF